MCNLIFFAGGLFFFLLLLGKIDPSGYSDIGRMATKPGWWILSIGMLFISVIFENLISEDFRFKR